MQDIKKGKKKMPLDLQDELLMEASQVGLKLNEDKTQYLRICRGYENEEAPSQVMNHSFQLTKSLHI